MSTTNNVTRVEIRYVPDDKIAEVTGLAMTGASGGFLPLDKLEVQDTPGFEHVKRPIDHPRSLETIYKAFQVVDGTEDERCAQLKIRSMTYGDAVVANGKAYYVSGSGFVTHDDAGELVPVVTP